MSVFIPNFKPKAQSKYKNTKIELDGHVFDSKAECERYKQLQTMQRAGAIKNFNIQPSFVLTAGIRYRPDFIVWDGSKIWVEDVKGMETAAFRMKEKMFHEQYPYLELRLIK